MTYSLHFSLIPKYSHNNTITLHSYFSVNKTATGFGFIRLKYIFLSSWVLQHFLKSTVI